MIIIMIIMKNVWDENYEMMEEKRHIDFYHRYESYFAQIKNFTNLLDQSIIEY